MYGALDISTSALTANRILLEVISSNIANTDAILNDQGEYEPFRRRIAMLAAGSEGNPEGVRVAEIQLDESPLRPKFEPSSPHADANGYVYYPNVNPVIEQMNAMIAQRSYEANVAAIEATKSMYGIALQMIG